MSEPMRIVIAGATGRMGGMVTEIAVQSPEVAIVGSVSRTEPGEGPALDALLGNCDVVIDVSTVPASTCLAARLATMAADRPPPGLVLGVTGFGASDRLAIAEAALRVPIVQAANFSIGLTLMNALVEQAAAGLNSQDWDIEILEAHHRRKRDAPSGSALLLGEAAASGRGVALSSVRASDREGLEKPREPGEIGFSSMRVGGLVGDHAVIFASEDEILTISHSARSRAAFARGALRAARWVRDKPPGLYGMADVLGEKP